MSQRLCPKCKRSLTDQENYFCSSCGESLEQSLIKHPLITVKETFVPSRTKAIYGFGLKVWGFIKDNLFHPEIDKSLFITLFSIVLIIGVAIVVIPKLKNFLYQSSIATNSPLSDTKNEKKDDNLVVLDIGARSGAFYQDNLSAYVPRDSEFYVESGDYVFFADYLLEDLEKYKLMVEKSEMLLNGSFALFGIKIDNNWEGGAILTPKSVAVVEDEVKESSVSEVKLKIIQDKLVIATSEKIFPLVEDAAKGMAPSIEAAPFFASAKAKLPKEGKIIVLFKEVPSKEVISLIIKNIPSDKLKILLEEILKSGYNELIVVEK
ncbi:MAG: hypothetical protein ACD_22C00234G0005 [uncultured bacterium]|nr:MAG: hypothetical protein ACD_22C00234G0005 [uncultured bacterium]